MASNHCPRERHSSRTLPAAARGRVQFANLPVHEQSASGCSLSYRSGDTRVASALSQASGRLGLTSLTHSELPASHFGPFRHPSHCELHLSCRTVMVHAQSLRFGCSRWGKLAAVGGDWVGGSWRHRGVEADARTCRADIAGMHFGTVHDTRASHCASSTGLGFERNRHSCSDRWPGNSGWNGLF